MKRLCRELNIPQYEAVGILENLWHVTAREAPQGDIGKLSNEDIAMGIDWHGNADALIEALITCRWLDVSRQFRLIVHDWHEHCDEAVRKKLKRNGLSFRSIAPTADNVGQRRDMERLPEPVPEPVPEPGPVPGPEPSATAAVAPPAKPQPLSPGGEGEFMAVTWLCEELGVVLAPGQRSMAAQHIAHSQREAGLVGEPLLALIKASALDARARGEPVDSWYLADGKWRTPPANGKSKRDRQKADFMAATEAEYGETAKA